MSVMLDLLEKAIFAANEGKRPCVVVAGFRERDHLRDLLSRAAKPRTAASVAVVSPGETMSGASFDSLYVDPAFNIGASEGERAWFNTSVLSRLKPGGIVSSS